MVWTREQCGTFLDSIVAERLYALFDSDRQVPMDEATRDVLRAE